MSVKDLQSYSEAVPTDVTGGTSLPHERVDGGVLKDGRSRSLTRLWL